MRSTLQQLQTCASRKLLQEDSSPGEADLVAVDPMTGEVNNFTQTDDMIEKHVFHSPANGLLAFHPPPPRLRWTGGFGGMAELWCVGSSDEV